VEKGIPDLTVMCDLDIEPSWHMRFDLHVWPWHWTKLAWDLTFMCDLDIEPSWHMRFDLYVWPWHWTKLA